MRTSEMYSSAKKLQRVLSANDIRKTFLDFFVIKHNHKHVQSSPVVPFCDPTVAFVNSGMNQFKSIFLGKCPAPYPRVVSSQKCVRVGGKHNDLEVVGKDGYHHTFFEMLGNWSFGDYFKREACEKALCLLQGPYKINIDRLYVTYFAGDKDLGLPADMECYDIWRSLGFPAHKILPFGTAENFWEMDVTGPCGPCTEIHYDHCPHLGTSEERAKLVNSGRPDITELWNLVFIQHNRYNRISEKDGVQGEFISDNSKEPSQNLLNNNADSTISLLPAKHVDTGMGFERLTALLQNKTSNYDTDLFTPFFDTIQKISKAPPYSGSFPNSINQAILDTGYRILADHVRMITVCLADGMLPDQNQKLRRVLRRALKVEEQIFSNGNLIMELIPVVIATLGTAYPELCRQQNNVAELVAFEKDVYKSVREKSAKAFAEVLNEFPNLRNIDLMEYSGFVPAYRDFQSKKSSFKNSVIPGKFLFKLFDTYGLSEESFNKLAALEGMTCDLIGYKQELFNAKLKSKISFNSIALFPNFDKSLKELTQRLPNTNNSFKYNYSYNAEKKCYNIQKLNATIQGILLNDNETATFKKCSTDSSSKEMTVSIITDKSNFYFESGGQQSDRGKIFLQPKEVTKPKLYLDVVNIMFMNNCVVHICKIPDSQMTDCDFEIKVGDEVALSVDVNHRQKNMCHHTATHLMNGALRTLFKKVTYQVSSAVTDRQCKLEIGIIGKRILKEDIAAIDNLISHIISCAIPVNVQTINATDVMQRNDITIIPGEIYPETGLRLISVECENPSFLSRELCCGTHVTNTQEMQYFCVTNLKLTGRARYAITAVAGEQAQKAFEDAILFEKRINELEQEFKTDKLTSVTEIELQKIRNNILHSSDLVLPYVSRVTTLERIAELLKRIKNSTRTTLNEFVEVEMKNLLLEKPVEKYPYILHYIRSSALVEEVSLQRATKLCVDRPILVVGMCNGVLKARCCVPKDFVTENFDAEKWLREFASCIDAQTVVKKEQNFSQICSLKGKKSSSEEELENAMARSDEYARQHFHKSTLKI